MVSGCLRDGVTVALLWSWSQSQPLPSSLWCTSYSIWGNLSLSWWWWPGSQSVGEMQEELQHLLFGGQQQQQHQQHQQQQQDRQDNVTMLPRVRTENTKEAKVLKPIGPKTNQSWCQIPGVIDRRRQSGFHWLWPWRLRFIQVNTISPFCPGYWYWYRWR